MLIVHTTPEHAELKAASAGAITKHHSHHYFDFAETQWRLFLKGDADENDGGAAATALPYHGRAA